MASMTLRSLEDDIGQRLRVRVADAPGRRTDDQRHRGSDPTVGEPALQKAHGLKSADRAVASAARLIGLVDDA